MNQRTSSCIVSAPSLSASPVEPTISQNSMLTRFNSPDGAFGSLSEAASSGAAQRPQKLFPGGFSAAQRGQKIGSGAAQWPQNRVPAGFSAWHCGHVM